MLTAGSVSSVAAGRISPQEVTRTSRYLITMAEPAPAAFTVQKLSMRYATTVINSVDSMRGFSATYNTATSAFTIQTLGPTFPKGTTGNGTVTIYDLTALGAEFTIAAGHYLGVWNSVQAQLWAGAVTNGGVHTTTTINPAVGLTRTVARVNEAYHILGEGVSI